MFITTDLANLKAGNRILHCLFLRSWLVPLPTCPARISTKTIKDTIDVVSSFKNVRDLLWLATLGGCDINGGFRTWRVRSQMYVSSHLMKALESSMQRSASLVGTGILTSLYLLHHDAPVHKGRLIWNFFSFLVRWYQSSAQIWLAEINSCYNLLIKLDFFLKVTGGILSSKFRFFCR